MNDRVNICTLIKVVVLIMFNKFSFSSLRIKMQTHKDQSTVMVLMETWHRNVLRHAFY